MEDNHIIDSMSIEEGMKEAYVDYAMSVIIARALPDVRDGCKPVHRRIIYTMFEEHITPDKKFRKSASTVGNVLARYHPHGDASVYDAMVRMAQPFNMRYPLVWPQGNFGSLDGDGAAHMRYTEAKMARIAMEMVRDLGKNTVDWRDNFDGSVQEPVVLPALLPNLIINGSEGIAVGMSTKIPPHNLREVVNGVLAYLENEDIGVDELMRYIPGPDFPTGAIIEGQKGARDVYAAGKGCIRMRSVTSIEEVRPGKQAIIVTEIPFQINKAKLVEDIAAKVNGGVITGITDLRDESSRKGIRIVIELAASANARIVLNNLLKHTNLQANYNAIMLALVNNVPRLLTLKEILGLYVEHRREVVTRRTQYELDKALAREHIVQAILKGLENIDAIIEIIENSSDADSARAALCEAFGFDEIQAQAILDMRLQRLTGLEYDKFAEEHKKLLADIAYDRSLLADRAKLDGVIRDELTQLKQRYSDERRTAITLAEGENIDVEDMITNDQFVVTLSQSGYCKRVSLNEYRTQARGGRGRSSLKLKQNDTLKQLFTCRAHDSLLFFTNKARVYRLRVYELPTNKRGSMGTALVNMLSLGPDEKVAVVIPLQAGQEVGSIITLTAQGYVKRTRLQEFARVPSRGKIALRLREDDELLTAVYSTSGFAQEDEAEAEDDGAENAAEELEELEEAEEAEAEEEAADSEVYEYGEGEESEEDISEDGAPAEDSVGGEVSLFIVTAYGRVLRFSERSVRFMGRGSMGVKTVNLRKGDYIAGFGSETHGEQLLIVTEKGMGKRIRLSEFSVKGRRGQGVVGININERSGKVVSALVVNKDSQIMVSTKDGITVRTDVGGMRLSRRGSGGVRLINVGEEDRVVALAYVVEEDRNSASMDDLDSFENVAAGQGGEAAADNEEFAEEAEGSESYEDFYENLPGLDEDEEA
ncbi:DNA gyrase subunit A [bacterium]|nr:DNA gyrase subunit A [bacterium]